MHIEIKTVSRNFRSLLVAFHFRDPVSSSVEIIDVPRATGFDSRRISNFFFLWLDVMSKTKQYSNRKWIWNWTEMKWQREEGREERLWHVSVGLLMSEKEREIEIRWTDDGKWDVQNISLSHQQPPHLHVTRLLLLNFERQLCSKHLLLNKLHSRILQHSKW